MPLERSFQPLKSIRVIDLSGVLAGPYATYQLGLLGAEVIKIEKPQTGDWARQGGDDELAALSMATGYLTQNAGKKSITLDLKHPEGLAIAKRLIESADVFVENFRPGVAARLKLDAGAVSTINPLIVYCAISAYGQDGAIAQRPAYDHVVQGMSGIMSTTGTTTSGPTKVGAPYVDYATGLNAAFAIVSALHEVNRTGKGVTLDVSMLDTSMMLMASLVTRHLTTGWEPNPAGNAAWSGSPSSGAFETLDGIIMIAANTELQFESLCKALDRSDIQCDPRWSSPGERKVNAEGLHDQISVSVSARTAREWEEILAMHGVPAARVRTLPEVLSENQFRHRGQWQEMKMPGINRPAYVPAVGFKADGESTGPSHPPPRLGQDTDEVLVSMGITAEQISALRDQGVV